jgi:hypothetical protein
MRLSVKYEKTPCTLYRAVDSLSLFCTENFTRTVKFQMDEGMYVGDLGSKRSEDFVSTVEI